MKYSFEIIPPLYRLRGVWIMASLYSHCVSVCLIYTEYTSKRGGEGADYCVFALLAFLSRTLPETSSRYNTLGII